MLKNWPGKDRRTRIVFIARDLDETELRNTLSMFANGWTRPPERPSDASGDSDVAISEVQT